VTASHRFDGATADALANLLYEPFQVGWKGKPVDVGDLGEAKLHEAPR
jgi:hypothetical protein